MQKALFISDIPTSLIDAFIATLEDVLNATSKLCSSPTY